MHVTPVLVVAFAIGGGFFNMVFDPSSPPVKRPVALIIIGSGLFVAGYYHHGLDQLGESLSFDGLRPFGAELGSNVFMAGLFSLAAISVAAAVSPTRRLARMLGTAIAVALASASFLFVGHCSVVSPRWHGLVRKRPKRHFRA